MSSRELIRRVLERDRPPRIGLTFSPYDGQPRQNDVAGAGPSPDPSFDEQRGLDNAGGECWRDEWGCRWRRIPGKTKGGEVIEAPIKDWSDLDTYRLPSFDDPARYEAVARSFEQHADMYRLGGISACSFDSARYLRRMEQYLLDCAAEPERVKRLNRLVSDLVLAQVSLYADAGADGVFFCEDWGTQDRLLVSPAMWREVFRPDFERLISHAHAKGLTVWMHSCGYVADIVPDLVELGMDVLQFDQPDLHGLDPLADFHDRVTFWCPVDIQTTLQTGSRDTIQAKAREMVRKLGTGGGLIAKDYPDEFSIGADPSWQHWAYEAFLEAGTFNDGGQA
jgi:uroporphyrinogen-III decarboxylase